MFDYDVDNNNNDIVKIVSKKAYGVPLLPLLFLHILLLLLIATFDYHN